MKRAALSIVLNIAEGAGKRSDRDFRRYLQNSLGSVHELLAAYDVAVSEKLITQQEWSQIAQILLEMRNQLGGFTKRLEQEMLSVES